MRRFAVLALALLAILIVVAVAGCGGTASTGGGTGTSGSSGGGTPSESAKVTIKGYAFDPATVEVKAGGTVTWTNEDGVDHEIAGEGWGGDPIATGKTYSNTFDSAGTFPYKCSIHPSMTGEVIVK